MINPIMHELVAREQHNDRLREIQQIRMAKAATRQPTSHTDPRGALGQFVNAVWYHFKASAYAKS